MTKTHTPTINSQVTKDIPVICFIIARKLGANPLLLNFFLSFFSHIGDLNSTIKKIQGFHTIARERLEQAFQQFCKEVDRFLKAQDMIFFGAATRKAI